MSGFLLKHLILFTPDFYVGQKAPAQFVTNLRSGMVGLEVTVVQSHENKC